MSWSHGTLLKELFAIPYTKQLHNYFYHIYCISYITDDTAKTYTLPMFPLSQTLLVLLHFSDPLCLWDTFLCCSTEDKVTDEFRSSVWVLLLEETLKKSSSESNSRGDFDLILLMGVVTASDLRGSTVDDEVTHVRASLTPMLFSLSTF